MKTFRLVTVQLLLMQDEQIITHDVPLDQGLIINREENDKSWLIEAVVPKNQETFFQDKQQREQMLVLEVIITDRHNDPALMKGTIRNVVMLNESVSVMIDAKMAANKDDISNLILEGLIEDGYRGDALLKEFSERKEDQIRWSKKLAERIYKESTV
ncbi:YwpF family protein [Salibacterium salarium]|nr:YwpF family protein [Salibacterium salarium]